MKKSRKLLCVLLALVMVVSLLPVMAFAADEDVAAEETTAATVEETSPETEGVITDVIKNLFAKLPNYLVAVKTSDGRVAAGAQVVIYNQNKDQVATAVANYGVAIFSKKDHLNTYSVSATWTDPNTNIKYQSLVGFNWSFGKKPDIDVITVYPTIDMILNTPNSRGSRSDGYSIRAAAIAADLPQFTTITEFQAALLAIEAVKHNDYQIMSIQEHSKQLFELERREF